MKQSIKLYIVINPDISKWHRERSYSIHQNFDHHTFTRAGKKKNLSKPKLLFYLNKKKKNQLLNNNFLGSEYFYMVVSRTVFSLLSAVNTIKFLIRKCETSVQEKTHSTQIIGFCKMMKKITQWNYSINPHQDMLLYCRIWLRVINYFLSSWHFFSLFWTLLATK